ncbi:MAG: hypothetical protein GY765_36280 [bacterium]|nr:hypothetical protein [bacterium]
MKQFEKKFSFKKITIDDLYDNNMERVLGGIRTVFGNRCLSLGCVTQHLEICRETLLCTTLTEGGCS